MTPYRKTRSLLLAVTALTALSGPAFAQTINNGGNQFQIPGVTVPGNGITNRNPAARAGVTSSVDQTLQDPGVSAPSEFSALGDNLGNHTAVEDLSLSGNDLLMNGGDLISGGGRVLGITLNPTEEAEAASKYYVDQLGTDLTNAITVIEGDVQTLFGRRINTPLNQGLIGGGPLSSDLTLTVDGTVVRTTGTQSIGGAKTFTGPVSLNGGRLLAVATPESPTDGVNKAYVDGIRDTLSGEIDDLTDTFLTRRIDTGAGLLGGGDLSANRTLTFDTSWGDGRYALRARLLSPGDGLSGGGDLSANRSFAVDATVVRTAGNQIIGGNKTFTGLLAFSNGRLTSVGTPTVASDAATKGYVDGVAAGIGTDLAELFARRINTGTGLLGGGDLTADRTLTFDTTWGDARYALAARALTAGDGLTGGGTLAGDRSFAVDGTVVRTAGAQTIAGAKAFRHWNGTLFDRGDGQDGVVLRGRAGGVDGFSVTITPGTLTANRVLTLADGGTTLVPGIMVPTGRSVLTGDGLSGGGDLSANRTLAVDGTVLRTSGDQSVAGVKAFSTSPTVPTPAASPQAANKGYVDAAITGLGGSLSARRIDTGTGLLGGGDLSADRTLTFDTTWGDARYALAARALTAGDGLTGGGTLAGDRSFAVDGTVVRTTRSVNTGTGLTGGGDLSANRTIAFDATWGDTRYAEHVAAGFSNTVTYDDLFGATGNGAATFGHSGAARPSDAPVTGQTGGLHIGNAWGRAQLLFPNASNRILFRNGTQTAWAEVWHSGNLSPTTLAPVTRTINAGTGLLGGGDLSADRTLSFDATWGDARYALAARSITPGTGLTGGGDLTANRALGLTGQALALHALGTNGLFARTGADTVAARAITQGAGIAVANGDGVAGNPTISVDTTVLRTTGNQSVAGVKAFSASPTVPTPVANAEAVNKGYVDTVVAGIGDGISARRIDTGTGLLGGGDLSANRTLTFDASWGDTRYAEHLTSGFSTTLTYDDVLGATGHGAATFGHVGTARPSDSPIGGVVSGVHVGNSGGRAQLIFPNSANRIFFRNGAQTAWAEVWHSGNLTPSDLTPKTRSILAGTGLTGGGDLSADRTLTFDTTWGDARYALAARALTAGDGLTGGGTLAGDRSFAVDGTVVRTAGAQTVAGEKAFRQGTGTRFERNAVLDGVVLRGGAAGTSGFAVTITPGPLTGNRVLTLADGGTTLVPGTMVPTGRSVLTGDGLSGGGDLSANRTLAVDATVLRTSGDQSVAGVKAFTTSPTVPTPAASAEAANKGYVDAAVAGATGTSYTASTGLTLNANQFSITNIGAGSTAIGAIRYNGTTAAAGRFYGGATDPVNTNRLNYDGSLFATRLFDAGARVVNEDRTLTAGTGLTGGGTLAADRSFGLTGQALALHSLGTSGLFARTGAGTVAARALAQGAGIAVTNGDGVAGNPIIAVDATVLRTSGDQSVAGVKAFTTSPTVPTPVASAEAANKGYVDAAVAGAGGTAYAASTGLTLNASNQFLLTDIAAGNAAVGAVRYNGTTLAAGRFYGGATDPVSTTRLNYDGSLFATRLFDAGARVVNVARTLTAGTGLTGGGTLAADRSFGLTGQALALHSLGTSGLFARTGAGTVAARALAQGAGIAVTNGDGVAGNPTVAVDATVLRTTGNQSVAGVKAFTTSPTVPTPVASAEAANKGYVDAAVAGAGGTAYAASTGLTLNASRQFLLTDIAAGSAAVGAVRYNGTTLAAGRFYGGAASPTGTTRLNYAGALYATSFYASSYYYFSDATLKENVARIDTSEGMGLIRQIRPVRYDWRDTGREALGVIAQEAAAILPNLVDTNEAGLMSVDYIQLIAPLIAAVQDLDARVRGLEEAAADPSPRP